MKRGKKVFFLIFLLIRYFYRFKSSYTLPCVKIHILSSFRSTFSIARRNYPGTKFSPSVLWPLISKTPPFKCLHLLLTPPAIQLFHKTGITNIHHLNRILHSSLVLSLALNKFYTVRIFILRWGTWLRDVDALSPTRGSRESISIFAFFIWFHQ